MNVHRSTTTTTTTKTAVTHKLIRIIGHCHYHCIPSKCYLDNRVFACVYDATYKCFILSDESITSRYIYVYL